MRISFMLSKLPFVTLTNKFQLFWKIKGPEGSKCACHVTSPVLWMMTQLGLKTETSKAGEQRGRSDLMI